MNTFYPCLRLERVIYIYYIKYIVRSESHVNHPNANQNRFRWRLSRSSIRDERPFLPASTKSVSLQCSGDAIRGSVCSSSPLPPLAKFISRGSVGARSISHAFSPGSREKRWEYTTDFAARDETDCKKPYIRSGRSCSKLRAQHPGARGTSVRRRVMPHRKARESKEPSRCSRHAHIDAWDPCTRTCAMRGE